MQGLPLDSFRQMAEEKLFGAVDGILERIPNGANYADAMHTAISGAMTEIMKQAQTTMASGQHESPLGDIGNLLGGLFGGNREANPPSH